jgi:hypothetical protein
MRIKGRIIDKGWPQRLRHSVAGGGQVAQRFYTAFTPHPCHLARSFHAPPYSGSVAFTVEEIMHDLIWLGGLVLLFGSTVGLLRVYHALSGRGAL